MLTLINGQPSEAIPITDRGLLYGDGLFETVSLRRGTPVFWASHMQRLMDGCRRLELPPPDPDQLHSEVLRVSDGAERAVAKIIITRGSGPRGYRPVPEPVTTRVVMGLTWPDLPVGADSSGVSARWCETRLARQPRLAGLKHLNRLEQILARAEWRDDYTEGLMLDSEGLVIEGTMSNLFLVQRGTLITPDLSQCGVAGVMRAAVLEHARQGGIPHTVRPVTVPMVEEADSLFLTNSLIGIWPILRLETRHYEVAGKITQTLQTAIQHTIDRLA